MSDSRCLIKFLCIGVEFMRFLVVSPPGYRNDDGGQFMSGSQDETERSRSERVVSGIYIDIYMCIYIGGNKGSGSTAGQPVNPGRGDQPSPMGAGRRSFWQLSRVACKIVESIFPWGPVLLPPTSTGRRSFCLRSPVACKIVERTLFAWRLLLPPDAP